MEKHKLSFLVFIVALMVISITVFSSQSSKKITEKKAGFSFAQDTVDIGYLQFGGSEKEVPIKIYNYEDTALLVQDIVSSCGCVLTDKKNFPIAHNDSSIIKTVIKAKQNDTKGLIHRTIAVRTNYIDPIQYVVIKAQII